MSSSLGRIHKKHIFSGRTTKRGKTPEPLRKPHEKKKKKNPLLSSVRVNQKTDQQKKVIKSLTKYIFENIIFSNFNLSEYFKEYFKEACRPFPSDKKKHKRNCFEPLSSRGGGVPILKWFDH